MTVVSDGVEVELVKGSSADVPASAGATTVSGAGTVFRATVPG